MADPGDMPFPAAPPGAPVEAARALRACLITLGGALFAVDVRHAREVVVFDDVTRVPRAPAHLVGVANLRGAIMPIVDLRPLLGLPTPRLGRSLRTLVVRGAGLEAAVVLEAVLGLEPFDEVLPAAEAGAGSAGFGVGCLRWTEGLATLLDVPRILETLRGSSDAQSLGAEGAGTARAGASR